ncbi:MAG TPA: DNA double-strand break repair nuclease NurA [Dictyobacter sp.]|jgi:hypothetical protein|nr:DNA double-strand break repair nuclease NurA [Dictyobacter sp.]
MLHKGKLQAALRAKGDQFSHFDGSFHEQLQRYRQTLASLSERYASSLELLTALPPDGVGYPPAGARPDIEFDHWLLESMQQGHQSPIFPFGREFQNHEQARQWAECIEGITTIAVDGSQLLPWRDASIPVGLIQVGFFINPHQSGQPYTKDVHLDVLTPEDIQEASSEEKAESDSFPYSDMQVTLRRYMLEVETLRDLMQQSAAQRQPDDPVYSPVVFFDGSLVVSFALTMPDPYRERYIQAAISLLQTSEELRIPLIGYIDTSYARDMITMLRRIDDTLPKPVLRDTKSIHDALLWQHQLQWGDRTPAMICARKDILESYGTYRDKVAFCYLQTGASRPPARLEFPRWMIDDGIVDSVLDIVRAEIIIGNGYPYAIETADAVSVITMQDRSEFYGHFQAFMQHQGVRFNYSTKSLSKNRRR